MAQYQQISSILTTEITTCVGGTNDAFAEHQLSHARVFVSVPRVTAPPLERGLPCLSRHRVRSHHVGNTPGRSEHRLAAVVDAMGAARSRAIAESACRWEPHVPAPMTGRGGNKGKRPGRILVGATRRSGDARRSCARSGRLPGALR